MERTLLDFWSQIWQFEYAVVPCLIALLVFDFPILIRRLTRKVYVPIYFAFFPFGYSDELYARYFDEDYFCEVGGPFHENEIRPARRKIFVTSVFSLILTMALSPFFAALFSYYYLTTEQQIQFFYTLTTVKTLTLGWSLYDLRWQYKITQVVPLKFLAAIYLAYWVGLIYFYNNALVWVENKDELGGIGLIASSILDFVFFEIGVQIILVGVIGTIITWLLTEGTAVPIEGERSSDEI